ncbi:MAG: glycosyltransferase family 9 protein [Verrucomicrobia bacterium]|nr:glycosyltransferase family 9 protein [Verrucomicrobiota bacterium]MDA1085428.1 glycosyltransferase family 9 protein [Verrucomicrobiota bacterium]
MSPPKYLVLRGGAIGDFILTLPALQSLRGACSGAEIELACYPHVGKLALAGGLVDRVTSLDRREFATIFSTKPQFDTEFVDYILEFEAIISYLYDPDQIAILNLNRAGGKRVIYANPIIKDRHASDQLSAPLDELDLRVVKQRHAFLSLDADSLDAGQKRCATLGDGVVLIHPGSGSPRKNWPLESYLKLARSLSETAGFSAVFSVGEADHDLESALASAGVALLKGLSLVELAAVLVHARGYVGNDSGITHLAAAANVPVIAIFGPTDPATWAPRSPNVHVITASGDPPELSTIPVCTVLEACTRSFAP